MQPTEYIYVIRGVWKVVHNIIPSQQIVWNVFTLTKWIIQLCTVLYNIHCRTISVLIWVSANIKWVFMCVLLVRTGKTRELKHRRFWSRDVNCCVLAFSIFSYTTNELESSYFRILQLDAFNEKGVIRSEEKKFRLLVDVHCSKTFVLKLCNTICKSTTMACIACKQAPTLQLLKILQ